LSGAEKITSQLTPQRSGGHVDHFRPPVRVSNIRG
jgi:hypothetical protein